METKFSSELSEARQASTIILDRLLVKAVEEAEMEPYYFTNGLQFFQRILETKPTFNPGMSEVKSSPACCLTSLHFDYLG